MANARAVVLSWAIFFSLDFFFFSYFFICVSGVRFCFVCLSGCILYIFSKVCMFQFGLVKVAANCQLFSDG